jgi:hypothetical protein
VSRVSRESSPPSLTRLGPTTFADRDRDQDTPMPPVYVPRMDSASADSSSVRAHFLRGVDFIEDHLLEPVALADAAKQAGFSLH